MTTIDIEKMDTSLFTQIVLALIITIFISLVYIMAYIIDYTEQHLILRRPELRIRALEIELAELRATINNN